MSRIIKRDDKPRRDRPSERLRASRPDRQTTVTRRLRKDGDEPPRMLIPVRSGADEQVVARAQKMNLNVCAIYLSTFRDLDQSDHTCSAVFSGRLDPSEIVSSAKLLDAGAVLTAHLPPNLAAGIVPAAEAAGLTLIGLDHPIGQSLMTAE